MANPSLVVPIADQTVTKGQSVSFSVATNIVDPDAGERLIYACAGLPVGTGGSIDQYTGVLSFPSGPSAADLAAFPFEVTVAAFRESNLNVSGSFTFRLESGDSVSTVAATYYITNTGVSGAGTLASPFSVAQWNNFNPASLSPAPTGPIDGQWMPGNYTDQPYIPRYGGLSSSVPIRNRVYSAGTVKWVGSGIASMIYAIELRSGTYAGVTYASNHVHFMRETGKVFDIDGQLVIGTGGGQYGKGQNPESYARIQKGLLVETTGYVLDLNMQRTAGWNGVDVGPNASGVYRINYTQHGSPFDHNNDDNGDMVWLPDTNSPSNRHLFDGG